MKRQIFLKGDSEVLGPGNAVDPINAQGQGGNPTANGPYKKLYEVWNTETPVPYYYAYCWPFTPEPWWSPYNQAIGFEKGPTLALFTKVTITCGFDYSQAGPNNWYFPPTNAHGPRCTIILRNREKTDWILGTGTATYTITGVDDYNVNINTHPGEYKLYTLTWEMTAHPQGGPWTYDDILDLAAGVRYAFSNGGNHRPPKPFNPSQGSNYKIRVPYLKVTLDIEDLGGFVSNVRAAASITLRMMRRARNVIKPVTLIDQAPSLVGERVYMSHPKGPSITRTGWGQRRLERRPGLILGREYVPEEFRVEDDVYDLNAFNCLGWGTYRIDAPWNPELQGVALIDKGRGWTHVRNQDAWSPRPGDGVVNRVLPDYPNVSFHGLAVQGGGDTAVCLYNYDLMQSGWSTVASTGNFTATADTTVHMVEEQGYLSCARLRYGPAGATGGRERSLGSLAGGRLHVRILVRNTSVPDPATQKAQWYLRRGSDYWNEVQREWIVGTPVYNDIPSSRTFTEVVADCIPITVATYHIAIGRFSSAMSAVTIHAALVDVQQTDTTVAGARTPLVTLGATINRVADTHKMAHVYGRELWDQNRGVAVCEFQPFWDSTQLPVNTVKPILHAQHAAGTWDAIQFIHPNSGFDKIRFERVISGEPTYQLDCDLGEGIFSTILSRLLVCRVWARWLGEDGWGEFAPYSVEVGYAAFTIGEDPDTGAETLSLERTRSAIGSLTSQIRVTYERDYLGIGCDETRYLDGYVRMWETRRNPIHGVEAIWRL